MSPEVKIRKIALLLKYIDDLSKHKTISFENYLKNHYEIERLLELLVETASDLTMHILTIKDDSVPTNYRSSFLRLGEIKLIPKKLSENLAKFAGMRNILVHGYEKVDDKIIHNSIKQAIVDFSKFVEEIKDIRL